MKAVAYAAGLVGLALLAILVVHADVPAIARVWTLAGASLLWVVPYRLIFFALYAIGWRAMLRPFDPGGGAGFGYVLWVTSVREAVDRLLPVASVGGGIVGVRLMSWRGLAIVPVSATVIVEILLTLMALYLFAALATVLLLALGPGGSHWRVLGALAFSLPIPVVSLLLLRYGSVFQRMQRFFSPLVGLSGAQSAISLDGDLRACLGRVRTLILAGALQWIALLSASLEIWWALRLFDHPVSPAAAVMLEGLT